MITKGFQINIDSDDYDEESEKLGLASNKKSYGASILSFVKREVSFHVEDDDEDEEDY